MMKRISGTVPQCITEDDDVDDQFPDINVIHGASIKGSCSATPTGREIHNGLLAHSEESYSRMLCYIMHNKY